MQLWNIKNRVLRGEPPLLRDRAASFEMGGGGGGPQFWAPLFLLEYFLFNLFLCLQKSGGGGLKLP